MNLKINDYQVPQEITFNFDELKNEVAERVNYYKDLVYTDDQIKEAKADRAKLRKVIEAIDSQRKQVKADLLQPYTALEQKLDEIKAIIQEPIDMIDNQVKAFEELQKQTKTESIKQTWENLAGPFDLMTIWNTKWLNTTYSMKKITDEMHEAIDKYNSGMETLDKLEEYSYEAIERFRQTLDLGQAMVLVNDLKEQAKRKAEYEARKAAVEDEPEHICKAHLAHSIEPPIPQTAPEEMKWITFTAHMTYRQVLELEKFFRMQGIEFRKGE